MQSDPDVARCARLNPVIALTNLPVLQVDRVGEKKQQTLGVMLESVAFSFLLFFVFSSEQQRGPWLSLWVVGPKQLFLNTVVVGGGAGLGSLMSLCETEDNLVLSSLLADKEGNGVLPLAAPSTLREDSAAYKLNFLGRFLLNLQGHAWTSQRLVVEERDADVQENHSWLFVSCEHVKPSSGRLRQEPHAERKPQKI